MSYLEELLTDGFTSTFRPENARMSGYLGMSMIGGCPLAAYWSFFQDDEPDARLTWYGFVGHALQHAISDMINVTGNVLAPSHHMYNVEATFDNRFRGHPDIIFQDNDVHALSIADVKSLDWYKYYELIENGTLPYSHQKSVDQVLMYVHHSYFAAGNGYIIYTPRDIKHSEWTDEDLSMLRKPTPLPFTVVKVDYDAGRIKELNQRAKDLLDAIDRGMQPKCECGWCKEERKEDEIPF